MPALETDLDRIAMLPDLQRDDDRAFYFDVPMAWDREACPDAELDALADALAAEVAPQIDCTATVRNPAAITSP